MSAKSQIFIKMNYQHSKSSSHQPNFAHKVQKDTCTGQSDFKYCPKNKLSVTLTLGSSMEYTHAPCAFTLHIWKWEQGDNVRGTRILS